MAKNYIEPGDQVDCVAPAGGFTSGSLYLVNGIVGVALTTVKEAENGVLKIKGAFNLPVTGGNAAPFGTRVYRLTAGTLSVTKGAGLEIGFILKPTLPAGEIPAANAVVCIGVQNIASAGA